MSSPLSCAITDLLGKLRVVQQTPDKRTESSEVSRIGKQQTESVVRYLITNAANLTGHNWASLPHGLQHSESETLRQAFLGDDRVVPLQGVDDDRVLLDIGHR